MKKSPKEDVNLNKHLYYTSYSPNRSIERLKTVQSGAVQVFFDDIEDQIVHQISQADAAFGCVAWLTSEPILEALSRIPVSLILQKEDFLRPDKSKYKDYKPDAWKAKLRQLYDRLWCDVSMEAIAENSVHEVIAQYFGAGAFLGSWQSNGYSYPINPIACMGEPRTPTDLTVARMHSKFLVLCHLEHVDPKTIDSRTGDIIDLSTDDNFIAHVVKPYAVWTGSYNFTANSTRSIENGLLITDPNIVSAYLDEFIYWYPFSEPLDWNHNWTPSSIVLDDSFF